MKQGQVSQKSVSTLHKLMKRLKDADIEAEQIDDSQASMWVKESLHKL